MYATYICYSGEHTLVNFSPEAVLQSLFGLLQLLLVLEAIQVGQHPHHLGEPVHLQMTSPDGPHAISVLVVLMAWEDLHAGNSPRIISVRRM